MRQLIRVGLRWTIAGFFVFASLAKFYSDFLRHDSSDTVYTQFVHPGSVPDAIILGGEFLLALWLLSARKPVIATTAAIILLSTYTGVLGAELTKPTPKSCGCLGASASNDPAAIRRDLWFSIGRNGLLMAGGVWLLLSKQPSTSAALPLVQELIPSTT